MNTATKRNEKEEILENLPTPEKTAELLAKANKVSSWMSELKQRSRLRPFVGKSEDGKFAIVIRDYRTTTRWTRWRSKNEKKIRH